MATKKRLDITTYTVSGRINPNTDKPISIKIGVMFPLKGDSFDEGARLIFDVPPPHRIDSYEGKKKLVIECVALKPRKWEGNKPSSKTDDEPDF